MIKLIKRRFGSIRVSKYQSQRSCRMGVLCVRGKMMNIFFKLYNTVVGETLAVFSWPRIRKTCQCLNGQTEKTFLEIFGGNYKFLKFREAMNALFFNLESPTIEISICRHLEANISVLQNPFSRDFFDFWSFIRLG